MLGINHQTPKKNSGEKKEKPYSNQSGKNNEITEISKQSSIITLNKYKWS
jgi:hypothetical protein